MPAPRDGTESEKKRPAIYGVSDFDWLQIPPVAPLLTGGCCRTLSDDPPSAHVHPLAVGIARFVGWASEVPPSSVAQGLESSGVVICAIAQLQGSASPDQIGHGVIVNGRV